MTYASTSVTKELLLIQYPFRPWTKRNSYHPLLNIIRIHVDAHPLALIILILAIFMLAPSHVTSTSSALTVT